MDLPRTMDGGQVLLGTWRPDRARGRRAVVRRVPRADGSNSDGVGVCVNALGMLHHDPRGLPVACAIRGALEQPTAAAAAAFLRSVPHASGQHYAVVDRSGDAYGLECSAGGATDSAPGTRPFFHANHPLASADVDPGVARDLALVENSRRRQAKLESAGPRSRAAPTAVRCSDRTAPVCASRADASGWLTFGAVAMELSDTTTMDVALGPPDEAAWIELELGR